MKKIRMIFILILAIGILGCQKSHHADAEYIESVLGHNFANYVNYHFGSGENKKYTVVANKSLSSFPNEDVANKTQSIFPDADIVFNIYEDDEFLFGSAIKYSKENDVGQGTTFKYGDGYCIILGESFEEEKFESEFQFDITDIVLGNNIKDVKLEVEQDSENNDFNWVKEFYKEVTLKEMPSGLKGKVIAVFEYEVDNDVLKIIHKKDRNTYIVFKDGKPFFSVESDGSGDYLNYLYHTYDEDDDVDEKFVLLCKENYNFAIAGTYISDNNEFNYEYVLKDNLPGVYPETKKSASLVVDYLKANLNKEFVLD